MSHIKNPGWQTIIDDYIIGCARAGTNMKNKLNCVIAGHSQRGLLQNLSLSNISAQFRNCKCSWSYWNCWSWRSWNWTGDRYNIRRYGWSIFNSVRVGDSGSNIRIGIRTIIKADTRNEIPELIWIIWERIALLQTI